MLIKVKVGTCTALFYPFHVFSVSLSRGEHRSFGKPTSQIGLQKIILATHTMVKMIFSRLCSENLCLLGVSCTFLFIWTLHRFCANEHATVCIMLTNADRTRSEKRIIDFPKTTRDVATCIATSAGALLLAYRRLIIFRFVLQFSVFKL